MTSKLKFKALLIYSKIAVHNCVAYLSSIWPVKNINWHIHRYHTITVNIYSDNPGWEKSITAFCMTKAESRLANIVLILSVF